MLKKKLNLNIITMSLSHPPAKQEDKEKEYNTDVTPKRKKHQNAKTPTGSVSSYHYDACSLA